MKNFYILIFICLSQILTAQEDPFPYQRDWGSYFGPYNTQPMDAVTDSRGNIYILSDVFAQESEDLANTYTTPNAYQPEYGGGPRDILLSKFDQTGNLVWATFYGGTGDESSSEIAIDQEDFIYIVGATDSEANISTVGAFQENLAATTNPNIRAGFIAKFTAQGNLAWGTYYDGEGFDGVQSIAINDNDNTLYVLGSTKSTTQIATAGSFQETLNSNPDLDGLQRNAFIAKFDLNGERSWATYYGAANKPTAVKSIATDTAGNAYILGHTEDSTGYFSTSNAYQENNKGEKDAYIAKFNADGDREWSTYYGGEDNDTAWDLEFFNGALFLSGITESTQHISTTGSYQENLSGNIDDFLLKMDIDGNPVWATYYGGPENEETNGGYLDYLGGKISLSQDGNVWLSSGTVNLTGIATEGAYQEVRNTSGFEGSADAYFVKFDQEGNRIYASYYGGDGADGNSGVLAVGEDSFYIFGRTSSSAGIATENAYQPSLPEGNYPNNIFLAKFVPKVLETSDFAKTTFSVWPNPTQDIFTISGKANQSLQVSVYDLQGRRVRKISNVQINNPIILQRELSVGIYFMKITGEKTQMQTLKLVVK